MSTSPTSTLSEPKGANKVPLSTLAYFRARLKQRVYNLVIREFKKSGLSQADLGRRLDKEPAQLSRMLSGPGNLTLETISDLLFAISGAELGLSTNYPLVTHDHPIVAGQVKAQAAPLPVGPATPLRTESIPGLIESLQEQAGLPIPVAA